MIYGMESVYHWGWECTCMAQPVHRGGFRVAVNCRSLIDGQAEPLIVDLLSCATARQAIFRAHELAETWAYENRHVIQSLLNEV